MSGLCIRRALNERTRKRDIFVSGLTGENKRYALHITKNREAIVTDMNDYSKVYAVYSLDYYNELQGGLTCG